MKQQEAAATNGDVAKEDVSKIFTARLSFFKLAVGGGASDMSRDTHWATCHELVFKILYLAFFSNNTRFYFNLEIILNKFGTVAGMPQVLT